MAGSENPPRRPRPAVTRLPPTVRLDAAAESPAVDAFIEAIGVGGGGAAAADVLIMGGSDFP